MKKKIITTRPGVKNSEIYSGICFETVNVPVTRLVQNPDINKIAILEFQPTVGVFTSATGAEIFLSLFPDNSLSGMRVVATGEKTAGALSRNYGKILVPAEWTSYGVNDALDKDISGEDRIALFSSGKSNGIILKHLEEKMWPHILVELYDAEVLDIGPLARELSSDECFGLIVTSSMEADAIFNKSNSKFLSYHEMAGKHIFAIGKTTAHTLAELGIAVSGPVGKSSLGELLAEIELEYCGQK